MGKRNKQKSHQKRKQARALKNQQRRKNYLQAKVGQEVVLHWDNINFFDDWKSLTPLDLIDKAFKMDVDEWVETYPKPKRDKDWFNLIHDDQFLYDWLTVTFEDCLTVWNDDTNGFTENLPERYAFNEKNKNKFITSLIKASSEDQGDDVVEESEIVDEANLIMDSERHRWFAITHEETLDEMILKMIPFIQSTVRGYFG